MKITIDNHDGQGPVDYSGALVAGKPLRILRRLNQPVTCEMTLFPSAGMVYPKRNGRIVVANDAGVVLFTGYVAAEPVLELVGRGTEGIVYQAAVSAISDEILLDRQFLPQIGPLCGVSSGQALETMLAVLQAENIASDLTQAKLSLPGFRTTNRRSWSENAGALAASVRSAYRVLDGTLTMTPIGTVTHSLNESDGSLSLSGLRLSMARPPANDVTVFGEAEPCTYVTEFFQGDGTTAMFYLSGKPWMPPATQAKPMNDSFQGSSINTQVWSVDDPGSALTLTGQGLTCGGGGSTIGTTVLAALSNLELGGGLVVEVGGVQFGQNTSGILNGCFNAGQVAVDSCIAGFLIGQTNGATTIAPLVNGVVAGNSFAPVAGHTYTLRLRFCSNEVQRILQSYYTVGTDNNPECIGGNLLSVSASLMFEVQDTTNGIAGAPVVLYSGSFITSPAPFCLFAPLAAGYLQCSIGYVSLEQLGPLWVTTTQTQGVPIQRRLGTTAQGADCTVDPSGKLLFYPTSTPLPGDVIAVTYRTSGRSVARLVNANSNTGESDGGLLPGTACWIGTVTIPPPRSSADCENAASAILAVSANRAAAWCGMYTDWNAARQGDVWPGDVVVVASESAGVSANLVVREVQIDLSCGAPNLTRYSIGFGNDWADEIAIRTTSSIPGDVLLPQEPELATPLANLNSLSVSSMTGSAIQISAGASAPQGGGFEVRRRDGSFGPGPGTDLVLRSPVSNFTIPRETAMERFYIRMYDGAAPPNYSRFSTALFVNLPVTNP